MKTPRFSIVMPVFNGEDHVAAAIESVLAQTFGDFELLVSDDCSIDATAELVTRYADRDRRVRLFRRAERSGPGSNRNFAITHAVAGWISFLDADDLWPEDHLRICDSAIRTCPDAVLFFGDYRRFRDVVASDGPTILERQEFFDANAPYVNEILQTPEGIGLTRLDSAAFLKHCCLRYCPISTPTVTLNREALRSNRIAFHEVWRINEDFHAWAQMLEIGSAVAIRHVLFYYRHNPDSLTNDQIRYLEGMALSHGEWLGRIQSRLDHAERLVYLDKVAGFLRSAAWAYSRQGRVADAAGANLRALRVRRQPGDVLGVARTILRAAFWRARILSGSRTPNGGES